MAEPADTPRPANVWTYVVDETTGERTPVTDRAAFLAELQARNADAVSGAEPAPVAPAEPERAQTAMPEPQTDEVDPETTVGPAPEPAPETPQTEPKGSRK